MTTVIRLANANDADGIAQLMKDGYDPKMLAVTIYGCEGIARYLETQLTLPLELMDAQYVVAARDDDILGFIEFKLIRNAIFLNYICTSPETRGTGLAARMLYEGTRLARDEEHSTMYLDVFHDNTNALSWYRKVGFSPTTQSAWWRIPVQRASGRKGRVSGHAQAEVCHAAYGFSNITLTTSQRSYLVGKLGTEWFKTNQPCLLSDDEALASLATLDPRREILGLLPANYPGERFDNAERLHVADRMSIDLDTLLTTLAERSPPQ